MADFNDISIMDDEDVDESIIPPLGYDGTGELYGQFLEGFSLVDDEDDFDESSPSSSSSTDLVAVEEQQQQLVKVLRASKNALIKTNDKAYQIITDSGVQSLSAETYNQELNQTKLQLSRNAPFFLSANNIATVRKLIDTVDGESKDASLRLLSQLMPVSEITDFHLDMFHNYIKQVKQADFARARDISERDSKNRSQVLALVQDLLDKQAPALPQNMLDFDESECSILAEAEITPSDVTFTCSSCGAKTVFNGILLSVLCSDKLTPIVTPLKCSSCGHYHILPKSGVSTLMHNLKKTKAKELLNNTSFENISLYTPPIDNLVEAFPEIISFRSTYHESKFKIEVNWESLVRDFIESEALYASDALAASDCGSLGFHNLAKIVGNQGNCYSLVKENALASLILCLQGTGFTKFTASNLFADELLYSYKGHEAFYPQVGEKLDLLPEEFDEHFAEFCKMVEERPRQRDLMVKQLEENKFYLANIPIVDYVLQDEHIAEFLSYEPLKRVLEDIADLMIIASGGENILSNLKHVKYKNNSLVERDASYDSRFRQLCKIKKQNFLDSQLQKFLEYFQETLDVSFSSNDFFASYSIDYNFLSIVSRFADTLLQGDYYQAEILRTSIRNDFKHVLKSLAESEKFQLVVDLVNEMPRVDVAQPRFSYYFPEETEMTKSEREIILGIQEKKRVTPARLIGNTFKEKVAYYNSYNVSRTNPVFEDAPLDAFVAAHLIQLVAMAHLDADLHFEDLTIYLVGRDLLFSLAEKPLDVVVKCLCLDRSICNSFIDSPEFEYPSKSIDVSKFITSVCFTEQSFSDLFRTEFLDGGLKSEIESATNVMLEDLKGLELPSKVLKEFLNGGN